MLLDASAPGGEVEMAKRKQPMNAQPSETSVSGAAATITVTNATDAGPLTQTSATPALQVVTCAGCGHQYTLPAVLPANAGGVCPKCGHKQPLAAPVKRTKVAIVGFADSWPMAPYSNMAWEVWCLNQFYDLCGARINLPDIAKEGRLRWFEQHMRHEIENDPNVIARHPHHLQKMRDFGAMGVPIYMQEVQPDVPNSVRFPIEEATRMFGDYWTNSISYMIALALMEGFKEVGLYGVNMAQDCLAPDMRVLTADLRWVPLHEVKEGQDLIGFDEDVPVRHTANERAQFRKYRRSTVEVVKQLTRPCFRLHMADGTKLITSADHRWMVCTGEERYWVAADRLRIEGTYRDNRSSKLVKLTNVWDSDNSREGGYLAAAFDGEGHLSQKQLSHCVASSMQIGFAQKPNGMSGEVERCLDLFGFRFNSKEGKGCTHWEITGTRAERMRFLGQVRPVRLLDKFNLELTGTANALANVPVVRKEPIGEQPVIGLKTSTGTFIAEGFGTHNSEYAQQRPSCEYFVGFARGLGVTVHIPPQSDLLMAPYRYGYDDDKLNKMLAKLEQQTTEHQAKMIAHQKAAEENANAAAQFNGAMQQIATTKRYFVLGR